MDWFANVRKQAQNAVNTALQSEAAERARQLAAQATEQATALAKEASVKAQAVAKEALSEAEKGLKTTVATLRQGPKSEEDAPDPLQYGLTPELEQFVRSLTYSTFSDYPLDSLDVPADAADHKLNSWQETHARLILQQVPQLQDLRFVLCPKRMDEYTFWTIYFTLCRRYLPVQSREQPELQQPSAAAPSSSHSTTNSSQPEAAAVSASSRSAEVAQQAEVEQPAPPAAAAATPLPQAAAVIAAVAGSSSAAAVSAVEDTAAAAAGDPEAAGVNTEDELTDLANDPELDAYLNDALQLDGDAAGGSADVDGVGSDLDDLDDYINKLDAEVS